MFASNEEIKILSWPQRALIAGLVVGVVAAGVWSYPWLRAQYDRRAQTRALTQIEEFRKKNDNLNAHLAIKVALEKDPGNARLWRLAADFLEQQNEPGALGYRKHLVEMEPGETANKVALIYTALRFLDIPTAKLALDSIPPAERESDAYFKAAAAFAIATNHIQEADRYLGRALRDAPDDLQSRLRRAALRARFGNPGTMASAKGDLQVLADLPATRLEAWRELALLALRQGRPADALAAARQIIALPGATFLDRLFLANLQRKQAEKSTADLLPDLQARAAQTPDNIAELTRWLVASGEAVIALNWLKTLPPETRALQAVQAAVLECQVALGDWPQVERLLADGGWGPVPRDVMHLAMSARILDENGRNALCDELWTEAVRLSATNLRALQVLQRLALTWGWEIKRRAALLQIAQLPGGNTWAAQTLVEDYTRLKDAEGLKTVYRVWHDADPDNDFVTNNWLYLSALTSVAPSGQVREQAARLTANNPGNPFYTTTQAFILWRQNQADDAVALMKTLPPEALREPRRALYYGLFLAAAKHTKDAPPYLDLVNPSELLPEEAALLDLARDLASRNPAAAPAKPAVRP